MDKPTDDSHVTMRTMAAARPLRVLLGTTGEAPFSENVASNVIESFLSPVLGQLTYSVGSFQVEPGLIEKWTYNTKTNEYLLSLQPNLIFHNGRSATASDVEFSLVRHLLSKYGSWFRAFFHNIKGVNELQDQAKYRSGLISGVRVIDDVRLAITLVQPNPFFMHSLARSYFSLAPREELQEDLLTWKNVPVGVGPYRVIQVNPETGQTTLEKIDAKWRGASTIEIFMKDDRSDFDVSIVGPWGQAQTRAGLQHPAGITLLTFNFDNPLARDSSFRSQVRSALDPKRANFDSFQLQPADQLLPHHFWGRIQRGNGDSQKQKNRSTIDTPQKILVYDSGSNSSGFFSFLSDLQTQLSNGGIEIEYIIENHKYQRTQPENYLAEIFTLGCDVMDPIALFSAFREGSPLGPYVPPRDDTFERLYHAATLSASPEERKTRVQELAHHFDEMNYAVPLFERYSTFSYNDSTVRALGRQNGSLTLYLNRIELK